MCEEIKKRTCSSCVFCTTRVYALPTEKNLKCTNIKVIDLFGSDYGTVWINHDFGCIFHEEREK